MNPAKQTITKYISDAAQMKSLLNGVFVIYKPFRRSVVDLKEELIRMICKDLNALKVRPPAQRVVIQGSTTGPMKVRVDVDYSDHPLVVGERYQPYQFRVTVANRIERDTSGVALCGIGEGVRLIARIRESQPTASYRIKGILGQATNNYFKTGRIVEKSTFKHVHRSIIDQLCSSMQSSHQKKMFELCGVDIQSQAAYELAVQGLIRPANTKIPMVYSIKCTDFTPPEFTIEVICINEHEMYLKAIIHELGQKLHSTATCTQIQCFRYAVFNLDHALLSKHWDVGSIANNIEVCREILAQNKTLLNQESVTLTAPTSV